MCKYGQNTMMLEDYQNMEAEGQITICQIMKEDAEIAVDCDMEEDGLIGLGFMRPACCYQDRKRERHKKTCHEEGTKPKPSRTLLS